MTKNISPKFQRNSSNYFLFKRDVVGYISEHKAKLFHLEILESVTILSYSICVEANEFCSESRKNLTILTSKIIKKREFH